MYMESGFTPWRLKKVRGDNIGKDAWKSVKNKEKPKSYSCLCLYSNKLKGEFVVSEVLFLWLLFLPSGLCSLRNSTNVY